MRSKISKIKRMMRPITVPVRRKIKYDRNVGILSYIRGVNSAHKPFPGGLVHVDNSTGGFLARIIELAEATTIEGKWLLVSEPKGAAKQIASSWFSSHQKHLPDIDSIENLLTTEWTSQDFTYDLCKYPIMENPPKYSVVMHQSLLEHVVDPITVIRNLNDFLLPGGIQVIQTVNIYCSLHPYPIDTLRFFPDFFANLYKYLPVKCLDTFIENGSIYAVLQNTSEI